MTEIQTWLFWVMLLGDAVTVVNILAIVWMMVWPPLGMHGTPHA